MSYIRADVLSAANGTSATTLTGQVAAKGWINYNGSSPAVRASFNISSVTKNGTGYYDINFQNAHVDANYGCSGVGGPGNDPPTGDLRIIILAQASSRTASVCRIGTTYSNGAGGYDLPDIHMSFFR